MLRVDAAHHAVSVVAPSPVEVGQVTVLVPPGPAVGQGAVSQSDVVVRVHRGPRTSLVVGHSVAWAEETR